MSPTRLAMLPAAMLAGCIMVSTSSGTSAPPVAFQSIPEGATVETDQGSCSTPCQLNLAPDRSHSASLSAAGYKPYHLDLHSEPVETGIPWWMTLGQTPSVLRPNPVMAILECADQQVCGARAFIKKYGGPTPASPP